MLNHGGIRQSGWIVNLFLAPLLVINEIRNVRNSRYDIHVEFSVKTFLYNLHVQQSKEATSEAKAESNGAFRHEGQGCIV